MVGLPDQRLVRSTEHHFTGWRHGLPGAARWVLHHAHHLYLVHAREVLSVRHAWRGAAGAIDELRVLSLTNVVVETLVDSVAALRTLFV